VSDTQHHHHSRHRADPTPLKYVTRTLLSLLPGRERPRSTERPASPLGVFASKELQHTDPRAIGVHQVLARLGCDRHGVEFLAATPSGELVTIKQLHSPGENDHPGRQTVEEANRAGFDGDHQVWNSGY
jgi:hypothetical protein